MVDRIDPKMTGLPPLWLSRITTASGNIGNSEEIRKIMGEPLPRLADLTRIQSRIAAMFAAGGVLERLAKKLGFFTGRRHKKIVAAHNTVACVDDEDALYVGVEFLEQFGDDEDLLAGILAHEWGHMISTFPRNADLSALTWEKIFEIRRDEEAYADGFAGRALYLMGYKPESMMAFLKKLAKTKLPSFKYHNTATRVAILKASFEAQERAFEMAEKLLDIKPKKLIGQG